MNKRCGCRDGRRWKKKRRRKSGLFVGGRGGGGLRGRGCWHPAALEEQNAKYNEAARWKKLNKHQPSLVEAVAAAAANSSLVVKLGPAAAAAAPGTAAPAEF